MPGCLTTAWFKDMEIVAVSDVLCVTRINWDISQQVRNLEFITEFFQLVTAA